MIITETWLSQRDEVVIGEVTPPGYKFLSLSRSSSSFGGGLGVIFKEELGLRSYTTGYNFRTFEHACFTDMCKSVYYFAIYRPPPSPRNGFTTAEFLSEFDTFVDFVNSLNSKLIIAGDFNLHVDVPTKSDVSHFLTTVLSASLTQHVIGLTHDLGHTLDLVISRESDHLITDCHIGSLLSDHFVVSCTVQLTKPQPVKTTVTTRKLNRVDCESFKCDLLSRFKSRNC